MKMTKVLYTMKNKVCCLFVMLSMIGCQQKSSKYYVDTESLFSESIKSAWNDSTKVINYYANGNVMNRGCYTDTTNSKGYLEGLFEEYYPDGFPKNRCVMSKGCNVSPKENGKYSGYDIKIDFGAYETINGDIIRPFRTFVDGVSTDEYIVAVSDTGGADYLPPKMPVIIRKYGIESGDDNRDTFKISIDESMYTYCIEDLNRSKVVNSNGDTCFLIFFYYKSIFDHSNPNDKKMVVVHDSLNWEVIDFEFE